MLYVYIYIYGYACVVLNYSFNLFAYLVNDLLAHSVMHAFVCFIHSFVH